MRPDQALPELTATLFADLDPVLQEVNPDWVLVQGDTTTVMVICDSLEKKRWLNRVKDLSDRRVNRLVLTEEGRSVFENAYPLIIAGYKLFVDAISEERITGILPILEELYWAIKEYHYKR